MTMIPFVCLGFGIMLGVLIKSNKFIKIANQVSKIALVFLMFSIGLGIGLNEAVINNLGRIGFNYAFISSDTNHRNHSYCCCTLFTTIVVSFIRVMILFCNIRNTL